jgi:hypothetical protein
MVSFPDDPDFEELDVEKERTILKSAVAPLEAAGQLSLDFIPATLRDLTRTLRNEQYHIFHFIGHARFDEANSDGALVFESDGGRALLTSGQQVGTFLAGHRSLRLAVLNACEGGRSAIDDPFAGVAQTLIQQGVPAVVAMQFEITDRAAISFSEDFYASLVLGLPVDLAVGEARKGIYAQPNATEWATPVLYMRSPDGVLFDLEFSASAHERKHILPVHDRGSQRVDQSTEQAKLPDGSSVEAPDKVGSFPQEQEAVSGSEELPAKEKRSESELDAAIEAGLERASLSALMADGHFLGAQGQWRESEQGFLNARAMCQDLLERDPSVLRHLFEIQISLIRIATRLTDVSSWEKYVNELIAMSKPAGTTRDTARYFVDVIDEVRGEPYYRLLMIPHYPSALSTRQERRLGNKCWRKWYRLEEGSDDMKRRYKLD